MSGVAQTTPACGPLHKAAANARYFSDCSGKPVYLAGSHNWNNFLDNGHRRSPETDNKLITDYNSYLDFLVVHHHNFFRLWKWESPMWTDDDPAGVKHCNPMLWLRTGPGVAHDGEPRFDLTRFDPAYFERMRNRIIQARDRGIYVSVMLFEGWEVQFTNAWAAHPFAKGNNVNDIDADANGDGRGLEYYTLQNSDMGRRVWAAQEAYLRKVVDTVDDLDNVLFEACNEAGVYSTEWQYRVIQYVKEYEASKAKQHPVGMTFQYPGGSNAVLFDSPADWISPNTGDPANSYLENPPPNLSGKVIVNDTDHLCGHTCGDNVWVWKSFTRGLNVLFMEELPPSPIWQDSARDGMGQSRLFSEQLNLAELKPRTDLASVKYCLARPGFEYVILQPGNYGQFTVNLIGASGTYSVHWLDINRNVFSTGKPVSGGSVLVFRTPFPGPAVLHLKRTGENGS